MTMNAPEWEPWQSTGIIVEICWDFKRSLAGKGSMIFIVWIVYYLPDQFGKN